MPSPVPKIVALLSDLDGTLLDCEPLYYDAYARCAAHFQRPYSGDFHVRHLLGRPEHVGAGAFVRELGVEEIDAEGLLALRDTFLDFRVTLPCAGAVSAVASLKSAGLACAIATSSMRSYLELKGTQPSSKELLGQFSHIVCGDDEVMLGKKGKPSPDIYLAAAEALGVATANCLVLEDSLAGIQAGKAAGCFVIAIPDPRVPREDVVAAGADIILGSLEDFRLSLLNL